MHTNSTRLKSSAGLSYNFNMNNGEAMKRNSMDVQRKTSGVKRVRFAEYSQLALTEPGSMVSQQYSFYAGRCY